MDVISEVEKEILRLEQEHSIKILYAVESGSRAWGFASTNSDWDVRFIYIHAKDWYLSIDDKKDTIEQILPNDIDLSGWELRKALKLFRKSNPPLMEWLISPIIYFENNTFTKKLRNLSCLYFEPRTCMSHYLHMAEGNFKEYLQTDMVRVKKYFYVLRPILACRWIEKYNTMPPMEFQKMLESEVPEGELKAEINKLLERKRVGEELNEEPQNAVIHSYVKESISYYLGYLKSHDKTVKPDTEKLNELFRWTLEMAWE